MANKLQAAIWWQSSLFQTIYSRGLVMCSYEYDLNKSPNCQIIQIIDKSCQQPFEQMLTEKLWNSSMCDCCSEMLKHKHQGKRLCVHTHSAVIGCSYSTSNMSFAELYIYTFDIFVNYHNLHATMKLQPWLHGSSLLAYNDSALLIPGGISWQHRHPWDHKLTWFIPLGSWKNNTKTALVTYNHLSV